MVELQKKPQWAGHYRIAYSIPQRLFLGIFDWPAPTRLDRITAHYETVSGFRGSAPPPERRSNSCIRSSSGASYENNPRLILPQGFSPSDEDHRPARTNPAKRPVELSTGILTVVLIGRGSPCGRALCFPNGNSRGAARDRLQAGLFSCFVSSC